MNWKDFKAQVEAAGVTDETLVGVVDVDYPVAGELVVEQEPMNDKGGNILFNVRCKY